ncbi:MAG: histidine triad nucleotide-binding protein [Patescibacteria group bacterium]|nr:histidine triad nucleotide-binding protein [Patescibacteria group bacterium]
MRECIFCKIANKDTHSEDIEYEDDTVIAFPDVHPIAPVHILIIPKKHIASINDLPENGEGEKIVGKLIMIAKKLAEKKGIDKDGYKLLFRTGKYGGQEVPHIHLHLIGGARLSEDIKPIYS